MSIVLSGVLCFRTPPVGFDARDWMCLFVVCVLFWCTDCFGCVSFHRKYICYTLQYFYLYFFYIFIYLFCVCCVLCWFRREFVIVCEYMIGIEWWYMIQSYVVFIISIYSFLSIYICVNTYMYSLCIYFLFCDLSKELVRSELINIKMHKWTDYFSQNISNILNYHI